nr:MAG TPA: hypothetical protein [Caudoviricetes sp.]
MQRSKRKSSQSYETFFLFIERHPHRIFFMKINIYCHEKKYLFT